VDVERLKALLDDIEADPTAAGEAALALLQERYGGTAFIMRMLRRRPEVLVPQSLRVLLRGGALSAREVEIAAIAAAAALHCDPCIDSHLRSGLAAGLSEEEAFEAIVIAGQIAETSTQAIAFRTFRRVVRGSETD
jgi:AhpD family alkylhydroperoxidase